MTAQDEVLSHREGGAWRKLEKIAQQMVEDAGQRAGSKMPVLLGGGTRIMLALNHRISDDIDLFIRDPQWIGYLTPRLNDRFESILDGYEENATSLKLKLPEGEIDFIVSMSLLGLPPESAPETVFPLEPVDEVLAKKLFYRGWALTPRDLFDWWKIECQSGPNPEICKLIRPKIDVIRAAIHAMSGSANAMKIWESIRAPALPDMREIVQWAENRLGDAFPDQDKARQEKGA